jgi:hypothetical protein
MHKAGAGLLMLQANHVGIDTRQGIDLPNRKAV